MAHKGTVIVVSGPAGAGKTTVVSGLCTARPKIRRSVSCTTRAPRAGEQDGLAYVFLRDPVFRSRVAAGEFAEHTTVHGHMYGTLRAAIDDHIDNGRDVVLTLDPEGSLHE